LLPTIQLC